MDMNIENCQLAYETAKKNYSESLNRDEKAKEKQKQEKYSSLNEKEKELLREYESTPSNGSSGGLRVLIFLTFIGIGLLLWFTYFKDTTVKFSIFSLITVIVASIMTPILMSGSTEKEKARQKRRAEIIEIPAINDYLNFCEEIESFVSEETHIAYNEYSKAAEQLYKISNLDTLFIYAPSSRTDDTITLYKSLTLQINGQIYCEKLRSGVTKIKLNPGYNNIRFETLERPKNENGMTSALREGYYGGSNTSAEFSCQIDNSNRMPAGIVLDKKNKFLILENMTFEQYNEYFGK